MSSRGGGGGGGGGGRRGGRGRGGDFAGEHEGHHRGGRGRGGDFAGVQEGRHRGGRGRGGDFSSEHEGHHRGGRGRGGDFSGEHEGHNRGGRGLGDDFSGGHESQHRGGRGGSARRDRGGDLAGGQGGQPGRDIMGGGGRGSGGTEPPSRPQPQPQPQPQPAMEEVLSSAVERMLVVSDARAGSSSSAATTAENVVKEVLAKPPPASSKAVVFPARPGFGTLGRRCKVRANHFLVQVADNDLFHYDVTIAPETRSRLRNRDIISELVGLHRQSLLGGRLPAYDGRASLYTAGALPFQSMDFAIKLADYRKIGDTKDEKEFIVNIKFAGKADLHSVRQFLAGRCRELPQKTIQALDIALRETPSTRYTTVSRSFFSQAFGHGGDIGEGVECWRGYYQSLRPTQMGLSLNIDISSTAFYRAEPVIDFAIQYLDIRDDSRRLFDKDRLKLKKALKGVRVEATHRRDLRIRYKITGISSVPVDELKFDCDGIQVSVVEYFKQKYSYPLEYTHWPCLQAGSDSRPTYLPMEVCNIVEGQRYSRKLNEHQVTRILKATCERPQQREKSILEMVHKNGYKDDRYAMEFGIRVMNQLSLVDARVLPAPRLKYHDSGKEKVCNPAVGQWNMINKRMINGGVIKYWACLSFTHRLHPNDVARFCGDLVGACNKFGMQIVPRPCVDIKQAHQGNLEAAIRDIHRRSMAVLAGQGAAGQQLDLLIIVLPDTSGFYGRIKRLCETELGIVTQCCLPKNVQKGNIQYLENVALKINVKVGGSNTVLEDAIHRRIPLVTDKPTIIFGADVTHPPPLEDASPSIAAVVASMNWPEVTTYKCLLSSQGHRDEIISNLFLDKDPQKDGRCGGMIRELLVSFYKANHRKPHRIIFYRDGVSEGQFSEVLLYEMDAIRKACASLEEGYLPPVTFVVVQKRHHTRLFPEVHGAQQMTDRSGNILPGTVVDTKICHPCEFDFYLCSHAGIQGTSRPTHYHVLLDENCFTADALQTLTYNLCYTYARCTRAVSIVPPAYYAHLAAFRARYYMEDVHSEGSSEGGPRTREQTVQIKQLPQVKDNVMQFMFYC